MGGVWYTIEEGKIAIPGGKTAMENLEAKVVQAIAAIREAVKFSTEGSTINKKLRKIAGEMAALIEEEF